jgi:autotransporter-associated beta strand protein
MKKSPNHPVIHTLALTCSLVTLLASPSLLRADDYTWNANAGGTWDTGTTNWTGAGSIWVNGNNATFVDITPTPAGYTVNIGTAITAGTIKSNSASSTLQITGGTTDVTTIQTTSNGNFDWYSVITGTHDLNYTAVSTSGGGRLNLKSANTYTGDTRLTGTATLTLGNSSGAPNDILPTGTTVHMDKGTQMLVFGANTTQKISGLVSTGSGSGSAPIINNRVGAGKTYGLTIETKSSTTTSFNGTLRNQNGSTELLNLTITGSGTQALAGTLSFSGTATVSGGSLSLGSSLTNVSSVTVNGGTLTNSANVTLGTGTVSMSSGAINIRGTGTVGNFTVAASQNFTTTGGTLNFDLLGGSTVDQILGSGTGKFSLTDTTLALSGSFASVVGTYQLFSGFGGANSVSNLTITGLGSGLTGSLDTTGLLTISTAAVPEPSTFAALAGAAMLGFAAVRRRRQNA